MNILVIADYGLYVNYSSSFIHAQAKAYHDLGHNVRVLITVPIGKHCNGTGGRFGKPITHKTVEGVKLYYLRILSFSNIGNKLKINTPFALSALKSNLKRVLDNFSPDVVHAHTFGTNSELGAYIKNTLSIPMVITTHGSDTTLRYFNNKRDEIKLYADKADCLVAISSVIAERLQDSRVSPPVKVILNGFRSNNIVTAKKTEHSIIQVSNLKAQKRVNITIQAFKQVHDAYDDATLTIVGDGSERESLERLASDLGLTDFVHFTGMLPNDKAMELLASRVIFCMPSVGEGFGIVYLEAMASGCYTIGTQGEGIADLITDGENGCLVPPNDVNATANAILKAFGDREQMQAIAEKGKQAAMSLTWAKNAEQNILLFESLINDLGLKR